MRLLDGPLPWEEIQYKLTMIEGNINRICVSDDIIEIASRLGFAIDGLCQIAYSRIMELENKTKGDNNT